MVFAGSVADDFQRGHTAVSAFWALVGRGPLHAGLARSKRSLRAAGFLLLGAMLPLHFRLRPGRAQRSCTRSVVPGRRRAILLAGFLDQRLAARSVEASVSGDAV